MCFHQSSWSEIAKLVLPKDRGISNKPKRGRDVGVEFTNGKQQGVTLTTFNLTSFKQGERISLNYLWHISFVFSTQCWPCLQCHHCELDDFSWNFNQSMFPEKVQKQRWKLSQYMVCQCHKTNTSNLYLIGEKGNICIGYIYDWTSLSNNRQTKQQGGRK